MKQLNTDTQHKRIEKAEGLNLNNDLWIFPSNIYLCLNSSDFT